VPNTPPDCGIVATCGVLALFAALCGSAVLGTPLLTLFAAL